ncbi:MAG: SDR family NAD(P)-dependent oxidoreductase [Acidobacteria bacterium]|nr:SDR family NAD(P)-dependent oxidoreductase [Acidobacteriota bacterium]
MSCVSSDFNIQTFFGGTMKSQDGSLLRNAAYLGLGLASTIISTLSDRTRNRANWTRGKVVVITGGSRGLGLAMAEEFGRRAARLVLSARNEVQLAEARRLLIDRGAVGSGDDVLIVAADLRKPEDASRLIDEATRRFGRVDVLINNAGVITVGPIENQTLQQFREVMESNFYSGLHCTMAVLPQMLQRREGSIATVSSVGGRISVPHLLPYCASKFAAVGFSEGLGMELRSKGVRVTTICPGLMRTGSHRNAVFTGDASREYQWFSLAANMPGASASARHAAKKIADGVAAGCAEITITPQALIAARLGNLSPEVKRIAMMAMNQALPDAKDGQNTPHRGEEVRERELFPASTIGTSAAQRYNQMSTFAESRLPDY